MGPFAFFSSWLHFPVDKRFPSPYLSNHRSGDHPASVTIKGTHAMTIPNEFTACETYKGVIIALKDGRYKGFNAKGEPLIGIGPEASRVAVRRAVDLIKHY